MEPVAPSSLTPSPRLETSLAARVNTLWMGFAGLLLLMAFAAVDATRTIQSLETTSAQLRQETRNRDILLDRLRTDLELSGTLARDYLLEADPEKVGRRKHDLEAMRKRSDETLAAYADVLPSDERATFTALQADARAYWSSLDPLLHWQPAERESKMDAYLQDVVLPQRSAVVKLAEQVGQLNSRDLDLAEQRLQVVQSGFRTRVMLVSGIALAVGLLLASVSVRRIRRLEIEAERRYQEAEATRAEMKRLADRLVITQEEERRNISRELHDEVGQSMSAMLVDLGIVESGLPAGAPNRERLTAARQLAETSVRSIRDLALLLRPSMLDDLGLIPALRWQAREVNRRTGLRVKMVAEDIGDDLPEAYRTCVYRVVQEALQNCVKHANATHVRVVVRQDAEGLSVSVQDDGVGFEPRQEKGAGLLGMEERVRVLGGQFAIDSKPGEGTVLSILLPLAPVPSKL